jgi:hypothetical protein
MTARTPSQKLCAQKDPIPSPKPLLSPIKTHALYKLSISNKRRFKVTQDSMQSNSLVSKPHVATEN